MTTGPRAAHLNQTEGPVELSVIIPAFNEALGVEAALRRYDEVLAHLPISYEILLIDDGSKDDTFVAAEGVARVNRRVKVLRNEENTGQVSCILQGFAVASGSVLLHNGADLPLAPEDTWELSKLWRNGADVIVVERESRYAYGTGRRVMSWLNVLLVRLLIRSPVSDHNFAQVYRREVIEQLNVETRGVSTVTTELIVKAARAGFEVTAVSLPYHARVSGESTIDLAKTAHSIWELLRLAWLLRSRPTRR